jgi:hypothetical protein
MITAGCRFGEEIPQSRFWVLISTSLRRFARLSVVVDKATENVHRLGLRG